MKPKEAFPWKNHPLPLHILDGAWASEWIAKEGFHRQCFDSYNITRPEEVRTLAARYVEAGSHIILTNTFQSSSFALRRSGWEKQWEAINRAGVRLSQEAAQNKAWVFASMGPLLVQKKQALAQKNRLRQSAQDQARVLAESGAEAIILETFSHPLETQIVVEALLDILNDFPLGLSGCFGFGENGFFSPEGWAVQEFIQTYASYPLAFWGANCGASLLQTTFFLEFFQAHSRPIWLKPGMGTPQLENGTFRYPFAQQVPWKKLFKPGVSFLGGCCGTTPAEIKRLRGLQGQFFDNP
ncbi:MAG: homocysteine S-methyltransferase family protein [Planctomycetota bacterium]